MKSAAIITSLAIFLASCGQAPDTATEKAPARQDAGEITASAKRVIIDVRTPEEWSGDGHAPCTINVPLDVLEKRIAEFKSYETVAVVCRTGSRADYAKEMLESAGIRTVENLGSWRNVDCAVP